MDLIILDKLKIEFEELKKKVINLEKFMQSKEFKNLSDENQLLLIEQLIHMRNYRQTLKRRIKLIEFESRIIY